MKTIYSQCEESDALLEQDIATLRRIAQKDVVAFQDFYRRHHNLIYATAASVLNDPQDAEDILQDVMVALWQKAHLYEPGKGRPLTWVTTMARNRAIDRIRAKQRRVRLYDDFGSDAAASQPEFDSSGADHMDVAEQRELLLGAIGQLAPDQREAVQLAYVKGLSQSEVARLLRQPLGTVKARIRRGVDRLGKLVRPQLQG